MRKIVILTLLIVVASLNAKPLLVNNTTLSELDWRTKTYAQLDEEKNGTDKAIFGGQEYLSTRTAFLLSLGVPGAGEAYAKSYVKAGLFLAAEAGLWIGYAALSNKGHSKEDEFNKYNDEHWDPVPYLEWYKVISNNFTEDRGTETLPHSGIWDTTTTPEEAAGSVVKTQQYYEMTGKYAWFLLGWDDAPRDSIQANPDDWDKLWSSSTSDQELANILNNYGDLSEHRLHYNEMRKDANDLLEYAKYCVGAAIFNHLLSAFDAAWTANRHNDRLNKGFSGAELHPAFAYDKMTDDYYPTMNLTVHFGM